MTAVTLHIYDVFGHDVAKTVNKVLRATGTGAFHAAVEVNGEEYSYGFVEEGTGVFSCPPKGCEAHSYRESHSMGETTKSPREVDALLQQMMEEWKGEEYDLLRHNCCHFSDAFCQRLGVGPIPAWVTNLAGAGATLHKGAQVASTSAQSAAIMAMAKAGEIDEQYKVQSKVHAGASGLLDRVVTLDQQYKISDQVAAGAQGLLTRASAADQQYQVSEQVGSGAKGLMQKVPGAQGLVATVGQMDEKFKVSGTVAAGAAGVTAAAHGVSAQGKVARGADASSGYQFGDFSRGLLSRWGGSIPASSGGYTGAAAAAAAPAPGSETNAK